MMAGGLLVECDFGGGDIEQCSMFGIEFSSGYWNPFVNKVSGLNYSIPTVYGGLLQPTFGDISFTQDMFLSRTPPPINFNIRLWWTNSTPSEATALFSGIAHRKSINSREVTYSLYTAAPTTINSGSASYTGTLSSVVSAFCTAAGIDYDGTYARSPSPTVDYTDSRADVSQLQIISDIAKFFAHMLVLEANPSGATNPFTLKLIDMKGTVGTPVVIDEFIRKPCQYTDSPPVSGVRASDTYAVYNSGSGVGFWYGNEMNVSPVCVTGDPTTYLQDVYDIAIKPQLQVSLLLPEISIQPGANLTYTENRFKIDFTVSMWVRRIYYDFTTLTLTAVGEGNIT